MEYYVTQPKDYWIAQNAINITLNALGDKNRIQCSVVSGAVIMCFLEDVKPASQGGDPENGDGLYYGANHEPKRWPLSISPTYFNTDSHKYVYVAIPRSEAVGTQAVIVFPSEELDIYGRARRLLTSEETGEPLLNEDGEQQVSYEQIGSTDYFYIYLNGIISAPAVNAATGREERGWERIITDWGKLETAQGREERQNSNEWFSYSQVNQVVTFLKEIAMGMGSSFRNLILNHKNLTDVATSETDYTDSDTMVATPGYVEKHYLSKSHDDSTPYSLTVGGILRAATGYITSLYSNLVQSTNYTGDGIADTGYRLTANHNGHSKLTIDEIYVRMKAVFESLEVRERTYAGGDQIWSCAGNRINRVDYLGNVETSDHAPEMMDVHADGRPAGTGEGDVYSVPVPGDTYGYSYVKVPWLLRQMPFLLRHRFFGRLRRVRIILNEQEDVSGRRAGGADSQIDKIRRARCYFLAKDDDMEVHNWWRINDLARCQTMNLANTTRKTYLSGEDQKAGNIFWWRKVIGVSYEPVKLDDGKEYHYFDVAFDYLLEQEHPEEMATSVMEGSDIPAASDSVVQFGNTIIEGRMNLMMMEVNGGDAVGYTPTTDAPCLKAYRGIYCFDLNKCWVGGSPRKMMLSPKSGYEFYGPNFKQVTEYDVVPVPVERGLWLDIVPTRDDYREHEMVRKCYYYDKVSHNGSYWLCSIVDGAHWVDGNGDYISDATYSALTEAQKALCSRKQNYTIEEPSADSIDWTEVVKRGEKGTSVREVKPYYAKQSPESYNGVPPQDGWEESIAALGTIAEGWYVWTKNVISFTDNVESTTTYTVSKWGIDGDGIENIETKFYESANLLTQTQLEGLDESDWKEYNQLALTKGDYIYTRTKITYDKGDTPTISYQVNRLGQDGVGYVGTEEYYVLGSSQTNVPSGHPYTGNQPYKKYTAAEWQQIQITGGWSESRPTYQGDANKYLWNFEVSFDTDGNAMVTRPICIGNYAKGIVSIVESYAISASAVAPQAGGYPSDIITWTDEAHDCAPTDAKPYQWNKTVTSYSDGTSDTFYHVSAVKGTRGRGITNTNIYYKADTTTPATPSGAPAQSGWSDDGNSLITDANANKHLYESTCTTYSDGTYSWTTPLDDGLIKDMAEMSEEFALADSGTIAPTTGWSTSVTPTAGKWVWSRTVLTFKNGNKKYVNTQCVGYCGIDGKSVSYDEEHSSIGYAYSSMGTPEAGRDYPSDITSWSPTPPAVQNGKYLWTKDVTAYDNAGTIVYTTTYGVQYQPNDGESVEIDSSRTFIKYCRQTKSQYTGQHPADSYFSTTYPTNLGQGDYLWILNQVAYVGVANPLKSYSVSMLGTDGSKGDPGADGYTTHFAYATSADGSQNFSTTNFNGATYIGTYRDQLPNDSTDYRDYVWTPWKGDKGDSVSYDEEHSSIGYSYSSMGTPEAGRDYPSDITSWSPTPPAVQKGKYLWTKDVTAYDNAGTIVYTTTYGVQYQPNDGESVEIDSSRTFIKYCQQTKSQYTGQHPADSYFSTTYPTNLGQGDYLWILNQVAYVGVANPLKSYSVSMLGTDGSKGDPGADGYTTHFAYATSADGSQNFSTTNFNGATYIGTYRDQLPNDSTDYRDYVWTPWKGDKGDSVSYDEEHSSIGYSYSSMGTPEAGRDYPSDITSWSPTPPAVQKGKYLWTKDVTAYDNAGTIVYTTTYGVQYQPNDGESVEIDSSRTFIKYCRQTKSQYTGQHPADSYFSTTYPTNLGQGDYLWILNQVAYVGVANPLKSYSVSMLGTDGSKGDPGADGYTTHFAYATSADGSQNFSTTNFNGATYIGTYRDQLPNDSTYYRDYVWTPWKGDKGDNGEQGEGGYGLSLTPTSLILESMISSGQEVVNYANNVVTVRVMKGSTPVQLTCSILTGTSSHSSNISISSSNIPVNNAGTYSTVTLAGGINLNNGESGFFTVRVRSNDNVFSQDVRINFYVNRAATFAREIKNGIETAMGAQTEYYDQLGGVIQRAYQAEIQTSAKGLTQQFTEQISKAGDYNRNLFGFHKGADFIRDYAIIPFIQGYGLVVTSNNGNRRQGRVSNLGFENVGGYFVVTFMAKTNADFTSYPNQQYAKVRVDLCDVEPIHNIGSIGDNINIAVNNNWQSYEYHFFLPEETPYMSSDSYNGFLDFEEAVESGITPIITNQGAYIYIRHLKIERGQTATDFCEADEDVAYLGQGNVAKNLSWSPYNANNDIYPASGTGRDNAYQVYVNLNQAAPWGYDGGNPRTFWTYINQSNVLKIKAGRCYTLTFWAKSSTNGFVISQFLYPNIITDIGIDLYVDASAGTIREGVKSDGHTNIQLSTSWKQYFVHLYAAVGDGQSDNYYVNVIPLRISKDLNVNKSGYVYMSDIELQEGYVTPTDYFASFITQNARRISLVQQSGTKLAGIDIQNGVVNLMGDRVVFTNSTGTISGNVWIDPENGTLHAVNGDFNGKVTATSGEFTGKVTATSGTIGGFTIDPNRLYNSNWNAGIDISTDDGKNVKIGKNAQGVMNTEDAIIRVENTKVLGGAYNTALYLNASGATYNYAFYGNGNGVLNGLMFGYKVQLYTIQSGYGDTISYLNIIGGSTIILNGSHGSGIVSIAAPKLPDVRKCLGINSSTIPFAIEFTVISHASYEHVSIIFRTANTGITDDSYLPWLMNEDDIHLTYDDASLQIAQGDVVKILLVYDNVGTTSSPNYEYRAYDLIRRV